MHPTDDVAGRHSQAFIECLVHPVVGFADKMRQTRSVFLDYFLRPVSRNPVYDDVFHIIIILRQDTLYRLTNGRCTIVAGGHDGDFWGFMGFSRHASGFDRSQSDRISSMAKRSFR